MQKCYFIPALFISLLCNAQASSSIITITKKYSQNKKFFIQSIPFDNEFPTLRGKSTVYKDDKVIYTIDRSFDYWGPSSTYLVISDDGKLVAYFMDDSYFDKSDNAALNNVTVYKNGTFIKSFSLKDFTGCDPDSDTCKLIYENLLTVIDKDKSSYGTVNYKKVFKQDVSEEELFLNEHAAMAVNDTIYITDNRKMVTLFDLKNVKIIGRKQFTEIYPTLKNIQVNNSEELTRIDAPEPSDAEFPNLINGQKTALALGEYLNMKPVFVNNPEYFKYKTYKVTINAYIDRSGKIDIVKLEADNKLPIEKVKLFFEENIYNMKFLPKELDRYYFHYFFWGYRNKNDSIAVQETKEAALLAIKEKEYRTTLDSVNHIYIPKDINDGLTQLDKTLSTLTKREIKALNNDLFSINGHMGGLGMWIRNNWGLHGGSRLLKYFNDRGITNPDHMSGIIIQHYFNKLNGKPDTWKDWEAANPLINK